ncbi:MAG: TadA family conjugal transfer-associated ATPase [Corynebacterium glucuronolyticum]|nr:TadA family conjugal transfer-associated ATPase [Corynebacterium glucuronolyticum]MDD7587675.1 TadA family conjugal transfer-associated ATPase [Mycobacteriaceae bacterium]MDY5833921.1 TadA family conjugal transfer-associated ATPase [Corynebacterium glucuronolyticum]
MGSVVDKLQEALATNPALTPAELARIARGEVGIVSDQQMLGLLQMVKNRVHGIGVLERLVAPGVTDIVVNGPASIWIDRGSGMERVEGRFFESDAEVRQLATRLMHTAGQRLDDAVPFAGGHLQRPDGQTIRLHAVLSPPASPGTLISLRLLRGATATLDRLGIPPELVAVLRGLVRARRSILVVGGTGTGKTTMLSALLAEVPATERIICIEDTAELHPPHPHVVSLVTRGANAEGRGEITMSDLLTQALRMRPDRIVVGEIRGREVVDLLAALNTGHDGGAGTVHANSLDEVPARMEALAALGGLDRQALHAQLVAAIDIIIHMARTPAGRVIHQIGVLVATPGKPLTTRVLWENGTPLDGWEELTCSL